MENHSNIYEIKIYVVLVERRVYKLKNSHPAMHRFLKQSNKNFNRNLFNQFHKKRLNFTRCEDFYLRQERKCYTKFYNNHLFINNYQNKWKCQSDLYG